MVIEGVEGRSAVIAKDRVWSGGLSSVLSGLGGRPDRGSGRPQVPRRPRPLGPPPLRGPYAWPPAAGRSPEVRPGRRLFSRKPGFLLFLSAPLLGSTARETGSWEQGSGVTGFPFLKAGRQLQIQHERWAWGN